MTEMKRKKWFNNGIKKVSGNTCHNKALSLIVTAPSNYFQPAPAIPCKAPSKKNEVTRQFRTVFHFGDSH